MRPKVNDIVFIPRALNRGRFVITAIDHGLASTHVKLMPEHGSHYDGGWQLQSSVEHCWQSAIANYVTGASIIESMNCDFEPERYAA